MLGQIKSAPHTHRITSTELGLDVLSQILSEEVIRNSHVECATNFAAHLPLSILFTASLTLWYSL